MRLGYFVSMGPLRRNDDFQQELLELDELVRRAYASYLHSRDMLFARYEAPDSPDLELLWRHYCEATETLERAMLETERFVGPAISDNLMEN